MNPEKPIEQVLEDFARNPRVIRFAEAHEIDPDELAAAIFKNLRSGKWRMAQAGMLEILKYEEQP